MGEDGLNTTTLLLGIMASASVRCRRRTGSAVVNTYFVANGDTVGHRLGTHRVHATVQL
jgi:hypothetical protein